MSERLSHPNPLPPSGGAYIIGKGPSLDSVTPASFPETTWPVLAINESIHAIEKLNLPNPVWCIQQDTRLTTTCRPHRAGWFCSSQAWGAAKAEGVPGAVMFVPGEYNACTSRTLSACIALELLNEAGIKKAVMIAFDAKFGIALDYAKCIGYDYTRYNKDTKRFLLYAGCIQKHGDKYGIELIWIPPPPLWHFATIQHRDGTTTRHVRAITGAIRANLRNSFKLAIVGDLTGNTRPLRRFPKIRAAGLFDPILFVQDCPVLYTPMSAAAVRPFTLPSPGAIEPGVVYMGPSPGDGMAGVMVWKAGTVTEPFVGASGAEGSEMDHLQKTLAGRIRPLTDIVKVGVWPCCKGIDIIQCQGTMRPWDTPPGLLALEEY